MEVLTASEVVGHLQTRGLNPSDDAQVIPLEGGVSSSVFAVSWGSTRWVVKQPLETLKVDADWHAKADRGETEALAIRFLHELTPASVPRLVDYDPRRFIVTMTAAPAVWTNWRDDLLAGAGPVADVAQRLGEILGLWHRNTWSDETVAAMFDDDEAFEELRINPFHRVIDDAHPGIIGVAACIRDLEEKRECLVHGDFSPKNVVTDGSDLWVLDYEVARVGAAAFDPGMLIAHLALKAAHRPPDAARFRAASETFLAAYRGTVGVTLATERLGWHAAAVMLARVDGASPAGYLTGRQRDLIRDVALQHLTDEGRQAELDWDLILEVTR